MQFGVDIPIIISTRHRERIKEESAKEIGIRASAMIFFIALDLLSRFQKQLFSAIPLMRHAVLDPNCRFLIFGLQ
jgi:hypothetical protein